MPTTLFYANQYTTKNLDGAIDDTQTTGITLTNSTGLDTTKPGIVAITWADPLNTSTVEWISYTSISTNELQGVVRGVEGSSGKAHSDQAVVAFPLSESHINNLATALSIGASATNGVQGTLDEDDMVSNSNTKIPTQQSVKAYVDASWIPAGETWTYAAADDPTFTFTIAGVDLTTKYYAGMRVKLTQTSAKYFIITKVAFSTDTTITIYGGTDYDLANAAITSPFYSMHYAPVGFPLNKEKWTVKVEDTTDRSKATPVNGTWYYTDLGSLNISVPIGAWNLDYMVGFQLNGATNQYFDGQCSLSTANNAVGSNSLTGGGAFFATGSSAPVATSAVYRSEFVTVASKTPYYLIASSQDGDTSLVGFSGSSVAPTIIRAICAYV